MAKKVYSTFPSPIIYHRYGYYVEGFTMRGRYKSELFDVGSKNEARRLFLQVHPSYNKKVVVRRIIISPDIPPVGDVYRKVKRKARRVVKRAKRK